MESKIAGIPTIATNRAYNKELVNDGITGFIMQSDTPEELARLLRKLLDNPARLRMMKEESLRSAEPFYVDAYLDSMAAELFSER